MEKQNTVLEYLHKGVDPITKKILDEKDIKQIDIYSWNWYILWFSRRSFPLILSKKGAENLTYSQSFFWQSFNYINGFLIKIPLLGGWGILLTSLFFFTYGLLIFPILDLFLGKKPFYKGLIILGSDNKPYFNASKNEIEEIAKKDGGSDIKLRLKKIFFIFVDGKRNLEKHWWHRLAKSFYGVISLILAIFVLDSSSGEELNTFLICLFIFFFLQFLYYKVLLYIVFGKK